MNALDGILRSELGSFALEMARITGLVVVSPLLWVEAPKRIRAAIVILFTVLVHGVGKVSPELAGAPELAVISLLSEFALGAAMGFVVKLSISVAENAANVMAPMIGFGAAQIFDPASGHPDTVLSSLLKSFGLWVALLTGMHHVVIGALLSSFQVVPVGSLVSPARLFPLMLQISSSVLSTGVRLALPLIAVVFMVQIALGFVSRAAPAMQIFSVGFAFTLVTGGIVLAVGMPDFGRELGVEFSYVLPRMESVLSAAQGP